MPADRHINITKHHRYTPYSPPNSKKSHSANSKTSHSAMSHSSNTTIPSDYSDISTTTAKKFKYPSYKRFNGVPSWNHKLPQPKGFHTTYQKNHTRKSPPYALFLYFTSLERQHPSKQYSVASPPSHAYTPPEYPKFNSVSNSKSEDFDMLQDYSSCEDIEMFEDDYDDEAPENNLTPVPKKPWFPPIKEPKSGSGEPVLTIPLIVPVMDDEALKDREIHVPEIPPIGTTYTYINEYGYRCALTHNYCYGQ